MNAPVGQVAGAVTTQSVTTMPGAGAPGPVIVHSDPPSGAAGVWSSTLFQVTEPAFCLLVYVQSTLSPGTTPATSVAASLGNVVVVVLPFRCVMVQEPLTNA